MIQLALIGTTEMLIIGAVVILLFGGRKLPELARAMGKSITEFKAGLKGDENEKGRIGEGKGRSERDEEVKERS